MRQAFNFSNLLRLIFAVTLFPLVVLAYVSPGAPRGFMNDFAGVLKTDEIVQLEAKLRDFEAATGNEISVVTIKSLDGDTVENYANELFSEWGIGKEGKDNGILFLAAIDDRQMRLEVGYGLEGVLTDAQSYWLEENLAVPAFRDGDYYLGISGVVEKIIAAIGGTEEIPGTTARGSANGFQFGDLFFLIFLVPVWLASILGRSKSWWLGGVLGGVAGVILGIFFGFLYLGLISIFGLGILGLIFDYFVSRAYQRGKQTGHFPWWIGGGRGGRGFGGGGFGGFGGGSSGGGGASSRW